MSQSPPFRSTSAGDAGLPLGAIIPGSQYRVITKLGSGGMGSVYAAEHVALEKRVALKVIRSDAAQSGDAIERLRDEARAASRIGSEFICDVTDFGKTPDGRVFLVMEYLDGPSLGRVLKEEGPLAPVRALPILRQIAKALEAAHEKRIVHLDVKPDNVMLLRRGRRLDAVKVVDFGVARLIGSMRREERVSGTPEYVAPERVIGSGYDHRADIYAFGILAYETLTGSVPFKGANSMATFTMQVEDKPPPMKSALGELPQQLVDAIMQMLEKEPEARPASMAIAEAMLCEAQIASGLHTAWDDLELPAVDEAWRKKLAARMPTPWGRQKMAVVAGALTLALAGGAASIYYGLLRDPEVVVKYVSLTQTEEAEGVAGWLEKAYSAANAQRYTRPYESSALYFIERAESEHSQVRGNTSRSKGADGLRRQYASALSVVGDELAKANLHHLAALKFREALLFSPNDSALATKAQLSDEERTRLRERPRAQPKEKAAAAPKPPPPPSPADEAKESAAQAYLLAAKQQKFSEARVALRALAGHDKDGWERAKLADAFRHRADDLWDAGKVAEARPFYQLTAELDSLDTEAKRRAQAVPPPAPAVAAAPAEKPAGAPVPAAVTPPPAPAAPAAKKPATFEELKSAPRDRKASQLSVDRGKNALGRLDLSIAERSFNLALEADPTNAAAIAGLAEVAFERSRYAEALDYARRAVQQAPRTSRYLVLVGDAYFKLLRYADAKAAYERALALGQQTEVARGRLERLRLKLRE